ncbi:MAG: hypothetical protein LBC68_02935 [Prevotellaceae bacterium]|nr:hypothetical protein [Prevotellaceae bacterium]
MVNKTIVNERYSVRNYRLVENNIKTCISRGVARRFFKSATATRAKVRM